MKLISAHIKNFRLLKDLKLDFATQGNPPFTVIRAANESGKTTTETALIWSLYGSDILPNKGKNYPLYPSDLAVSGRKNLKISVEIEFESDQVVSLGRGKQQINTCRYQLIRSCNESPSSTGLVNRNNEHVTLFEITSTGTNEITGQRVRAVIESSIPESLKDVYFTDGDSAMSFIEAAATQGVKRRRVKGAVESLLGLGVLENTIKHVGRAAKTFAAQIDDTNYSKELERLNDSIEGYQEDLSDWDKEQKEKENNIQEGERKLKRIRTEIEDTLKLGDREKLVFDISNCKQRIRSANDSATQELKQLSSIFRNTNLASSLISNAANDGLDILEKLYKNKQLPKVNIPILEELLDRESCFCGTNLSSDDQEGKQRREFISSAIEASRKADALSESASALFYSVRSKSFDGEATNKWMKIYENSSFEYQKRKSEVLEDEGKLKELEEKVDLINDSSLEELRETEKNLVSTINRYRADVSALATKIQGSQEWLSDKERERSKIEKKLHKTDTTADKLHTARLAEKLFKKVYDRLRLEELEQVSEEMNRIFLDMIGSDPEANNLTNITRAELTKEFDIKVYGPNEHTLNPDQDLNGASRRAITLAFILALTKVSKVIAPNVIDTPLGMMSGYVKQSVVNKLLEEGSQIILFLTHDEIQGIEEIIDKMAGKIYTLTNPAHYPKMLANQPEINDARIIRCECNHRNTCSICERKSATN